MSDPVGPKRPGTLERLFGGGSLSRTLSKDPAMQLPWIGFRIFKWLLLAIAVIIALIAVFAWQTYPAQKDVLDVLGSGASGTDKLAALKDARTAWLGQVKDLAQLFVFASFFPAMTAVTGYIFGVSRQKDGGAQDGGNGGDGSAGDGSTGGGAGVEAASPRPPGMHSDTPASDQVVVAGSGGDTGPDIN